jgi:hypothetical protein
MNGVSVRDRLDESLICFFLSSTHVLLLLLLLLLRGAIDMYKSDF